MVEAAVVEAAVVEAAVVETYWVLGGDDGTEAADVKRAGDPGRHRGPQGEGCRLRSAAMRAISRRLPRWRTQMRPAMPTASQR